MEMEIIKVQKINREQKDWSSDELEIITLSEETQNENKKKIDKKLGTFDLDFDIDILPAFLFDEDRRYTKEDLKYNVLALKWASWLKLSPYGVDEDSKNFLGFRMRHKKWWGNLISFGWFLSACIRIFIGFLQTVHFGMTGNPEENLGQITLTITMLICACLVLFGLASGIVSAQDLGPLLCSVFKYLEADVETETRTGTALQQKKSHQKKFGRGFGFDFRRHTLKELLIILLPFFIYPVAGIAPFMIAADPSFPLLLASNVQPEISFSFLSLAALDSIIFPYYIMIIHSVFYVFIGMHRIQEEAQLTLRNLTKTKTTTPTKNENEREEIMKIQKALKSLSLLRIWTHFFNSSFTNTVYVIKLMALTASTLGGFGLIKMIEVENWPYAGIFGIAFFEGIILYNLFFGRAFEIPEKVEDLKREIRKQSFKLYKYNSFERKYVEKYLRSIPWLGIKDGEIDLRQLYDLCCSRSYESGSGSLSTNNNYC